MIRPAPSLGEVNGGPLVVPPDEHNRTLVANVRPPDWRNPEPAGRYNLVVLGAGTAGLVTAAGAAGLGARVALVEKHLMGGDCLNVGCVPSKALIRAARAAAAVRDASGFGVRIGGDIDIDFAAVMERLRRTRAEISPHDSAARFRDLGVDVFLGPGRFIGTDVVEVAGQTLRFRKAVIATGARAAAPPIPGSPRPATSRTRPSSRSPRCPGGWPSSGPVRSAASCASLRPPRRRGDAPRGATPDPWQ